MTELTRSQILTALDEWGAYVPRFQSLAAQDQAEFLKVQGYASLRDLLAHIVGWWDEAESVISATIEQRERPRRDYEFDAFNAESVARFKDTPEADLLTWFEALRKKMIALATALTDEQLKIRRVSVWLDGPVLSHIKEHNLYASRFLLTDALNREWADYVPEFRAMPEEKQKAFLQKQGFANFRDLIAHIIGWWEIVLNAVDAIARDTKYVSPSKDVDLYNAELVERSSHLGEDEVGKDFETHRLQLVELVRSLPDDMLDKEEVQTWLKSDVLEHYYEHAY